MLYPGKFTWTLSTPPSSSAVELLLMLLSLLSKSPPGFIFLIPVFNSSLTPGPPSWFFKGLLYPASPSIHLSSTAALRASEYHCFWPQTILLNVSSAPTNLPLEQTLAQTRDWVLEEQKNQTVPALNEFPVY